MPHILSIRIPKEKSRALPQTRTRGSAALYKRVPKFYVLPAQSGLQFLSYRVKAFATTQTYKNLGQLVVAEEPFVKECGVIQ